MHLLRRPVTSVLSTFDYSLEHVCYREERGHFRNAICAQMAGRLGLVDVYLAIVGVVSFSTGLPRFPIRHTVKIQPKRTFAISSSGTLPKPFLGDRGRIRPTRGVSSPGALQVSKISMLLKEIELRSSILRFLKSSSFIGKSAGAANPSVFNEVLQN
jgi:hypothetical protein